MLLEEVRERFQSVEYLQVAAYPVIGEYPDKDQQICHGSDEWFQAKQIKPNIYAEVAGHEAIVSMVALGCGISIVPKAVVEQSPVSNNIEILNLKPELKPFNVSLCVNKNRFNEKIIEAFWNIVDSINVMDNNNM